MDEHLYQFPLVADSESSDNKDEGDAFSPAQCATCQTCKPCTSDHPDQPWKSLLYQFTQDTTFHGIKYITAETRYLIRRLIWILITGIAVGIFLYYVVDRVSEYLQYRTTVSVQEVYVEKMPFPAVTICNQNKIKVTEAAKGEWYQAVDLLNTQAAPTKNLRACMSSEFQCEGGKCVPLSQKCDTFPDCPLGDDELNCDPCPMLQLSYTDDPTIGYTLGSVYILQSHTYATSFPVYIHATDQQQPMYLYYKQYERKWVFGPQVGGDEVLAYVNSTSSAPQSVVNRWTYVDTGGPLGGATFDVNCYQLTLYSGATGQLPERIANLRLEHIYRNGGHRAEDFIKRCTWKGVDCRPRDFKPRFTDMGLCYTFDGSDMYVEQSGPGFALGMTLNIEQYEYTKDLQTGVGVKMLLHDKHDTPMMKERAFAISPGLYTMVAIEKTQLENLPSPWGHCSEKSLTYFDHYTEANCVRNCQNVRARQMCGCRDINMPLRGEDDKPSCTIEQYRECLLENIDGVCECGRPCLETKYITSLSFASIATDDDVLKRRSQEKSMAELRAKLAKAREVGYRVQAPKRQETQRVFQMVSLHVSTLYWFLMALDLQLKQDTSDVYQIAEITKSDCLDLGQRQYDVTRALQDTQHALDRYMQFYEYKIVGGLLSLRYYLQSIGDGYTQQENHFLGMDNRKVLLTEDDVTIKLHDIVVELGTTNSSVNASGVRINTRRGNLYGAEVSVWLQDDSVWQKGSQVWTKYVSFRGLTEDLKASLKVLRNEFRTNVVREISAVQEPDVALNENLLRPLTPDIYAHCDWCLTNKNEPIVTALKTQILEYVDNQLIGHLVRMLNTTSFLYERYLEQNNSNPSDAAEIRRGIADEVDGLITNAQGLTQEMNTTLLTPTVSAKRLVVELLRQTDSLCKLAWEQQFASYKAWQSRLQTTTAHMVAYTHAYAEKFESTKEKYQANNMTLEKLSEEVKLESVRDHMEIESPRLITRSKELSLSTRAMRTHIRETYQWLHAQSTMGYYSVSRLSNVSNNVYTLMSDIYTNVNFEENARNDEEDDDDDVNSLGEKYARRLDDKIGGAKDTVHPVDMTSSDMFWEFIVRRLDRVDNHMTFHQKQLSTTLTEAQNIFDKFVEGNKINEVFFKKNFLQVDIFYKSLTDKSVIQQRAYEYPTLLGEIGGLMGLLLGASVLTIFEVLDLFFYHGAVKCTLHCCKQQKKLRWFNQNPRKTTKNGSYTTTTTVI